MPAAGWKRWVIDYDQPCPSCGYSLRGLRLKDRCPECSREIPDYSVTEERHLLHRADRRFLTHLSLGSLLLEWLAPFHIVAAFATGLSGILPLQIGVMVICVLVWFGGWTLVASEDPTLGPSAPFNSSARLCRRMGLVVLAAAAAFVATVWSVRRISPPSTTLVAAGAAVVALWCVLAGLHAVVCISHKDAILWRAHRLLPRPRSLPAPIWIVATLVGLPLHLYLFTRADRLRRAAALALRADPSP